MTEVKIEALDQVQLWNGPAGEAWVAMQAQLDRLFAPFEALLVSAVRWHRPARVLDIGCGTGATTLAIARELAGRGSCTGADLSQIMIDRARERAAAEPDAVAAAFV
uniref:class I SAM-dependent methyltransferase n=1 Tax=Sphingomonas sp. TaxID=28214 RepID=UPI0031DF3E18